ncbi:hypothetical protein N7E81_03900 [Reichenbachiella carrageenanivorans]|uniref:MetA-pathway of phenol degradation n=1 Tax=Reichenbachiella carrageenanivorans TaxID=2979869 RepID=A0ABY6D262_9BACT|nr:hypothetical protein [Reichenbachiella carrageenanivorans]UXX80242.1 hypothetical protein N7E81_03900 [Reichenbachiella carrageenanivorans]
MINLNSICKTFIVLLFAVFLFHNTQAQESIATARPTLSVGPWVLPEHSFQWEQGAQYVDIKGEEWAYDAFFRASISKSAEIRVFVPTLEHKVAAFGVKWMMIQPEGKKPGVGFSVNMSSFGDNFVISGYRVAVNKKLMDNLVGFVNAGKAAGGYFGDFTLAYGLGDRFTVVGEYWHHEDWQQAQTGLTYLINSETQIDINGGLLFNAANDYTFGVGFARRFKYNGPRNDG